MSRTGPNNVGALRLSRGRFAVLGFVLLLGLLLGCVWLVPSLLDWNRYRDSIAALATAAIGRPVRIAGDVTLHLLPQPILTASNIAVDDTGDGVVLVADALRLRVALGSLLTGQIDAQDLVVQGVALHLPWPPAPGALSQRPPAWLTSLRARIETSRLTIGAMQIDQVNAQIATDPDTGTLSATGTGQMRGRGWRFTTRLGRPGRDGIAGLELSLDGQDALRDTGGTFSGQLGGDGALAGRVVGRGPDLSQLLPAPAVPWKADGRLSAVSGLAVADELTLEIDGSSASGAVALRVQPEPRLDLALTAGRLDGDAWLGVLMGGPTMGMPTGLDLSAEAASLAGGTVRRLRGAFDVDASGVVVRELTANLPGDAPFGLVGRFPHGGGAFDGTARLAAPDLRTTFRWLMGLLPPMPGLGVRDMPDGVLRTANVSGQISIQANGRSVMGLQGTVDGAAIGGSIGVRSQPRPAVTVALTLDRLALDPFIPDGGGAGLTAAAAQVIEALGRAAAIDSEVRLQVARASWRDVGMAGLLWESQAEGGRLMVRRAEVTPLGIKLSASGTVGEGGRIADGRIEASAADLSVLKPLLPPDVAARQTLLRGAGGGQALLSGPPSALSLRINADIGDLRIEAQPTVNLATRSWAGAVTLRHPGAPRLLDGVGVPGTAAWLGDGSLSLLAQVAAGPDRVALDGLSLAAGALRAQGQLAVGGLGPGTDRPTVTGSLQAEVLPLPWPVLRAPDPLPAERLRGWQAQVKMEAASVLLGQTPVLQTAAFGLQVRDGVLRLDGFAAHLSGGLVTGAATLDAAQAVPRFTADGTLTGVALAMPVFDAAVDLGSGVLDGTASLSATGHSMAAMLATLGGRATASVRDGVLSGIDLPGAAHTLSDSDTGTIVTKLRAALQGGSTPFERLNIRLDSAGGVVTLDSALASPAGDLMMGGSIDLPAASADLRLQLRPSMEAGPPPAIAVRLTGPVSRLRRTPELAAVSRWLSDRVP